MLLTKEKIIVKMALPPRQEEASVLLANAVKKAVCADYRNLEKFASVLKVLNDKSIILVANSLLRDYSESNSMHDIVTLFQL